MDTQGLHDNETTQDDNSRIFSLGTLICSIQVFNLSIRIQEDHLNYLQFSTEYAKFTGVNSEYSTEHPFQKLMFLIRDWSNPDDHEFGIQGGKKYLEEVLEIKQNQKSELQKVRDSISSSFDEISCNLLPYPGFTVASSKDFDGSWSQMNENFKKELKDVVEELLLPEKLIVKKINSKKSTGTEIKQFIEVYFELFQSNDIPKVQNFYEATVKNTMDIILKKCIFTYKELLESKGFIDEENHVAVQNECSKVAMDIYSEAKKMGKEYDEQKYKCKLEFQINDIFDQWQKQQQAKAEVQQKEKEKQKVEEERNQAEAKAQQAELEKQKVEEENRQIEAKAQKIEEEKNQVEAKAQQTELKNQKLEIEKRKIEEENRVVLEKIQQTELEKQKLEKEREEQNKKYERRIQQLEAKAEQALNDRKNYEEKMREIDEIKSQTEARIKQIELAKQKAEQAQTIAETNAKQVQAIAESKIDQEKKDRLKAETAQLKAENRADQAENERQKAHRAQLKAENMAAHEKKERENADQIRIGAEIKANQAEKERQIAEKAQVTAENKTEIAENKLQKCEKDAMDLSKRIKHLEDILKDMKKQINDRSLSKKLGNFGYSREQDEDIQKLVTFINGID